MCTERMLAVFVLGCGVLTGCADAETSSDQSDRASAALAGADPVIGAGERAASTSLSAEPPVTGSSRDPREIECDGIDQDGDGSDLCTEDADRDGVRGSADCDDTAPGVSPLEWDAPCDGVDQNCNGFDDCDSDRDGWLDRFDCDPRDPRSRGECRPTRGGTDWVSL